MAFEYNKIPSVTITVSGPGSNINYEVEVIRRALVAEGIFVDVVNDYPSNDMDHYVEHRRKLIAEGREGFVRIVADHQPWGG